MPKLGLYLHIPFCLRKCAYCDFHSAPADKGARTEYVRALVSHLVAIAPDCKDYTVDTVYFGGGTPTLLDGADFAAILDTVRAHFALEKNAEITAECNPAAGTASLLREMRRAGVNRLSIGLQSANDEELRLLGRLHDFDTFKETYRHAREAGFDNISIDLMFGIPSQTPVSFESTVNEILALSPEHISAYGLRIEEGTPLDGMRNSYIFPSEDEECAMVDLLASRLPASGYRHYEISNFAKEGKESRHNLRYWLGADYLGFGPGAHSYFGGVRFETAPNTAAYIAHVQNGDFEALRQNKTLISGKELQDEYVMLRMRLFEGLDLADFKHRFGTSFEEAYGDPTPLIKANMLTQTPRGIAFTESGMRVSNAVLSDWLDFGH